MKVAESKNERREQFLVDLIDGDRLDARYDMPIYPLVIGSASQFAHLHQEKNQLVVVSKGPL